MCAFSLILDIHHNHVTRTLKLLKSPETSEPGIN